MGKRASTPTMQGRTTSSTTPVAAQATARRSRSRHRPQLRVPQDNAAVQRGQPSPRHPPPRPVLQGPSAEQVRAQSRTTQDQKDKQDADSSAQETGPDFYGSDPPSTPKTADYEAAVLPPHLRRLLQGPSIYAAATSSRRAWFQVSARNPIYLDIMVEEGTKVADLQHLTCGIYRRGEDLDLDDHLRQGDQIWWRPQALPLLLQPPDLRAGGKLTDVEKQANMRAALQVVARLQVLNVMQAKFLLRGQSKLVKTMNSALSDKEQRLRIERTAAKLGVSLPTAAAGTTTPSSSSAATTSRSPNHNQQQGRSRSCDGRRTVQLQPAGQNPSTLTPSSATSSSTTTAASRARSAPHHHRPSQTTQRPTPDSEWSLPPNKWSVPYVKLIPGGSGITLAMNEDHATRLWRAHAHQKAPAAMIAPRQIKTIPRHAQEEVVFDIVEKKGDVHHQNILGGILIQFGETPVVNLQQTQPIIVETKAPSTCVLALELVRELLPGPLEQAVKLGRYKRELQELLSQTLGQDTHLDLFKQRDFPTYTQVMVRVPATHLTELVMSSGSSGLFWSPVGDARKDFAVIWLRGDTATDYVAAKQAAMDRGAALFHREGHYALRVHAVEADPTRAALAWLPGSFISYKAYHSMKIRETSSRSSPPCIGRPPHYQKDAKSSVEWQSGACVLRSLPLGTGLP